MYNELPNSHQRVLQITCDRGGGGGGGGGLSSCLSVLALSPHVCALHKLDFRYACIVPLTCMHRIESPCTLNQWCKRAEQLREEKSMMREYREDEHACMHACMAASPHLSSRRLGGLQLMWLIYGSIASIMHQAHAEKQDQNYIYSKTLFWLRGSLSS